MYLCKYYNVYTIQVITAPKNLDLKYPSIFLAGSIEQDKAERWLDGVFQKRLNSISVFSGYRDITSRDQPYRKTKRDIDNIPSFLRKEIDFFFYLSP